MPKKQEAAPLVKEVAKEENNEDATMTFPKDRLLQSPREDALREQGTLEAP